MLESRVTRWKRCIQAYTDGRPTSTQSYQGLHCFKNVLLQKKAELMPRKDCRCPGGGWVWQRCHACISRHRGIQLILAYSWAMPAILVAGKGRGGMYLFRLFLHFHSCSSSFPVPLFHLLYYLFCIFSPFLWETK